jgi:hypothetical protein
VAITDALAGFPPDEIVIATHPAGRANWIERGLVDRSRARFDVPIVHLVTSYVLIEDAA